MKTILSGSRFNLIHAFLIVAMIFVSACHSGGQVAADDSSNQAPAVNAPDTATVAPPPDAPASVQAKAGDGHIVLSWTVVSNTTSYNIYWKDSPGVTKSDTSINVNASSYDHQGLTNGTTYYYAIASVNSGGEGSLSTEVSAMPQIPLPAMPVNVTATPGDKHVAVAWDAVTGATSYRVYWQNSSGVTKQDSYFTVGTNSFDDINLSNGTPYYYAVSAINAAGEGNLSNEVSATPQVPLPGAPQNIKAVAGYESVTVSWDPVDYGATYNIYWSTSSGVNKTNGTKIANAISPYLHEYLTGGQAFYYIVTAVDAAGEGPESAQVSATSNYPLLKTFVTSVSGKGNLSAWADANGKVGLEAADAICQSRAVTAGLRGQYKAWISDDDSDAYCRMIGLWGKKEVDTPLPATYCSQLTAPDVHAGPWTRTDGTPFSESINSMLSPNLEVYTPPSTDEFGNAVDDELIFTNTDETGINAVASPCGNWSADSGNSTNAGYTLATGWDWTNFYLGSDCSTQARLLCMQTGIGSPLPAFAQVAKVAFVSSVWGDGKFGDWPQAGGNTGLAAADSICQTIAANEHLSNAEKFKAWASDSTNNAKDRLTSNGPWVRPDGVKVANSKTDIINGSLLAPINETETAVYLAGEATWTATAKGLKMSNTCSNWTSNAHATNGGFGAADTSSTLWSSWYSGHCDTMYHLYCFEDQ